MYLRAFHGICLVISFFDLVISYRILGLFPYPGKSHSDVYLPLMKELSRRGHDVDVLTHFPSKNVHHSYKDLSIEGSHPILLHTEPTNNLDYLTGRILFMYLDVLEMGFMADHYCEAAFQTNAVKRLMSSNETYDLIIHEPFTSDCLLALNQKFKAPVVGVTTSVMLPWNNQRFANPDNPSFIPTLFMDNSDRMTFLQRFENTIVAYAHHFWFKMKEEHHDQIVRKYMRHHDFFSEYSKNIDLMLVNSHFSLNFARPFVPNVVEVGGIHLKKPKPISQVSLQAYES